MASSVVSIEVNLGILQVRLVAVAIGDRLIELGLIRSRVDHDFHAARGKLRSRPRTHVSGAGYFFVDSQDGKQLDQGTLNLVDNQIIRTTDTIRLRAQFANKKQLLWPAQLVNAQLLLYAA